MTKIFAGLTWAALAVQFLGFAPAAFAPTAFAKEYPDPRYLQKTVIDVATVIPPAPKPGSKEDQTDFARILAYQSSRTEMDCKRAAFVVEVSLNTLFGPEYGPLTAEEVAQWAPHFEKARIDTDYFVQEAKKRWGRPRPFLANSKVTPCVRKEVTRAYPSGHAAIARTFALLLGELDPARKGRFEARAEQIAEDRVVAGVHHPADIDAGKKLGEEVYKKLMGSERFRKELDAIKPAPAPEPAKQ